MAHAQLAFDDQRLDRRRKLKQAHQIGDMAARLMDDLGQRFLGMAIIAHQPGIGFRLFDGVQILALDILDKRYFKCLGIVEVTNDHRDFMKPGALGGPPAPLAGDNLVLPTTVWARDDRLKHAVLLDRVSKLSQRIIIKLLPGLIHIWLNIVQCYLLDALSAIEQYRIVKISWQQPVQSSSQM